MDEFKDLREENEGKEKINKGAPKQHLNRSMDESNGVGVEDGGYTHMSRALYRKESKESLLVSKNRRSIDNHSSQGSIRV